MKYKSYLDKCLKSEVLNSPPKAVPFDKYNFYTRSVQSPETDVEFFEQTFRRLKKRKPEYFMEDFCGTFRLSCEWIKLNKGYKSVGVDLDTEPLNYGYQNYFTELNSEQRTRLELINASVLDKNLPKADIVAACNFSYYLFKKRADLKAYFSAARQRVRKDGIYIVDCFGGPACQLPNEEETVHKGFSYFWHQESFNPITHEALFHIHFKEKGKAKRRKVFSYDWRLWTLPELQEILLEAGFKNPTVYWEGTESNGVDGNGIFSPTVSGEACEAWVCYIISEV